MSRVLNNDSIIQREIEQNNTKKTECTPVVALATFFLIAGGTLSVTSFKLQSTEYGFKHGVFQVKLMFIGEWANLLIFWFLIGFNKKKQEVHFKALQNESIKHDQDLQFTKLWMAIPCFLDTVASALSLVSLLLTPASVNVMLSGSSVVFIVVTSRIVLKRLILKHHAVACVLSTIGFITVGWAGIIGSQESEATYSTNDLILGIILNIFYLILGSLHSVVQEIILRKKAINVQRMIGLEGQFGLIWGFILCVIFSMVPCTNPNMCDIGGYFDDIVLAVDEILTQPGLMVYCALSALAVLILNLCGLILVKHVSAVFKSFWGSLSILSIWAVNLLIGEEKLVLVPALLQFTGFIFLLLGNFTYNEVIEWKFFGLNSEMKKYTSSSSSTPLKTKLPIQEGAEDNDS